MPSLKGLGCSIELGHPAHALQEYGTAYGDGFVETFIAVPSEPQKFSVHLMSNMYIAEGLAMYVFIDGVYQCNRNRRGLEDRQGTGKPLGSKTLVNFTVRQKEERQQDGEMIAREWGFEKLNTGKSPPTGLYFPPYLTHGSLRRSGPRPMFEEYR